MRKLDEYSPWLQCWNYFRKTQDVTIYKLLHWTNAHIGSGTMRYHIARLSEAKLVGSDLNFSTGHSILLFGDGSSYKLLKECLLSDNIQQAVDDAQYIIEESMQIKLDYYFSRSVVQRFLAYLALYELLWHLPLNGVTRYE